jgi:hypothetical protein
MAHIGVPDGFARLENLVKFLEYPPSKRCLPALAFDSEVVAPRMDLDIEGSFDESERRFTVSVEGGSGRVIVESQALVSCCLFPSQ